MLSWARGAANLVRLAVAVCFLFCIGACANTPPLWQPTADYDSAPLWKLHWNQETEARRKLLNDAAWEQSGSIEAERYRQADAIQRGQRLAEYRRADVRVQQQPNNPSAHYLRARLLQDPVRLSSEFQQLAKRWPNHAWIQLGAAGSLQNIGKYRLAAAHLRAAPDWPDAREFRLLVTARQLLGQNHDEPWLPLMDLAFIHGSPDALYEVQQYAMQKQNFALQRLCRAELDLRQGANEEESERLQHLIQRALRELESERIADVAELLNKMEGWSELLQLPRGWSKAKRYRLPGGLGMLVPPESGDDECLELLARHNTALMIGESVTTEPTLLALYEVERRLLEWPGESRPVELVLAGSGDSSQDAYFPGAALFRGFYARRDLSERQADGIAAQLQRLHDNGVQKEDLYSTGASMTEEMDRGHQSPGRLAEDFDLPIRLRLLATWDVAQLGEDALEQRVKELEWQHLLLHEAGHLPDVLPWTRSEGGLLSAIKMGFQSLLRDGMLLGEWEYRAQLCALASSPNPHWALAEIVEVARTPQHPYYKPYRRLLADLIRAADSDKLFSELPKWIENDAVELQRLARAAMEPLSMKPLPSDFVKQLAAD